MKTTLHSKSTFTSLWTVARRSSLISPVTRPCFAASYTKSLCCLVDIVERIATPTYAIFEGVTMISAGVEGICVVFRVIVVARVRVRIRVRIRVMT